MYEITQQEKNQLLGNIGSLADYLLKNPERFLPVKVLVTYVYCTAKEEIGPSVLEPDAFVSREKLEVILSRVLAYVLSVRSNCVATGQTSTVEQYKDSTI